MSGKVSHRTPAFSIGGRTLREGDCLTVDGDRGLIYLGDCVEAGNEEPCELRMLRNWAVELGIELGSETAADSRDAVATEIRTDNACQADAFALLRALSPLGFASPERIAVSLATSSGVVSELISAVLQADHVAGAPRGLHVTPDGRAWLRAQLQAEREGIDREAADRIYRSFIAHDEDFKCLITDWQIRVVDGKRVAYDHEDRGYDDIVRRRLAVFHESISSLMAEIVCMAGRLKPFAIRFASAAAAVASSDSSMIASPLKDSYHTVWFELHEELMHLSGRNRSAKEAKSVGS